jgi:hypothetical protein
MESSDQSQASVITSLILPQVDFDLVLVEPHESHRRQAETATFNHTRWTTPEDAESGPVDPILEGNPSTPFDLIATSIQEDTLAITNEGIAFFTISSIVEALSKPKEEPPEEGSEDLSDAGFTQGSNQTSEIVSEESSEEPSEETSGYSSGESFAGISSKEDYSASEGTEPSDSKMSFPSHAPSLDTEISFKEDFSASEGTEPSDSKMSFPSHAPALDTESLWDTLNGTE